ncbi:MAG TPA: choice-of-anchor tandem repeat GloVer-containing protein, partial [Terriglobales bacterium]
MTRHQATTIFVLSAALFAMCSATPALADTYKILHTFKKTDGQGPKASMIFDASGKLYSTTFGGGANNNGTVFQMTHQKDGDWSESVLYSFCPSTGCADGSGPQGSLIFDTKGNLYGTTTVGGSAGGGVVFELKAGPKNTWTESVLYNFCSLTNCTDGEEPWAAVIFDASGNLYGTAKKGGANAQGVVFKLAPGAGGTWTESVLYSFCALSDCADGATPYSDLIFDASGNMYGTTFGGGTTSNSGCPSMDDRCGTVFELSPATGGTWTHQVIYSFNFTDGSDSENGVVFDTHGNLYGNTSRGGSGEGGVIYELSPAGGGTWT